MFPAAYDNTNLNSLCGHLDNLFGYIVDNVKVKRPVFKENRALLR